MANLISTNIENNEVIKAVDIINGNTAAIDNIAKSMDVVFDPIHDFIIGGKITPSTTGMTFTIAPVFGICHTDTNGNNACSPIVETEQSENFNLPNSQSTDIRAIIEIYGELVDTTPEQRAYIDFDNGSKTLREAKTKKELKLKCLSFSNNTSTAPTKTNGHIKICEVLIPANATTADQCTFYEITSDVKEMDNDNWTVEKNVTYNAGYISDVNAKFRQAHKQDGSHKVNSIDSTMIVKSGNNPINANVLNVAGTGTIADDTTTFINTASILSVLQKVAEKITSLYTDYQSNGGAYRFKGELVLSNDESFDEATAVKIGSNGDGSGYIKIGTKLICTITADGKIIMAVNNKELVTKDITDGLSTRVEANETAIAGFDNIVKNSQQYSNETFNRIKYGTSVKVAATENITNMYGPQIIQNVSIEVGDRVLVMGQADKTQNGIYNVNNETWTRTTDYNLEHINNLLLHLFSVEAGNNEGKLFYCPLPIEKYTSGSELNFVESILAVGNNANTVVFRNENNEIKGDLNGCAYRIPTEQKSSEPGAMWLE